MMGIVMPETCSAYMKYNKITSDIYLGLYSSVITMLHGPINIRYEKKNYAQKFRPDVNKLFLRNNSI